VRGPKGILKVPHLLLPGTVHNAGPYAFMEDRRGEHVRVLYEVLADMDVVLQVKAKFLVKIQTASNTDEVFSECVGDHELITREEVLLDHVAQARPGLMELP
jgi:hypothetical protein